MFCFGDDLINRKIIKNHLKKEWIKSNSIKNIYSQIYLHLTSEEVVKPEIVMNELKIESERNLMAELLFNKINVNKNMVVDCLIRMEKNYIQSNLNMLREKLKTSSNDENLNTELLSQVNELQKQKNNLRTKYENI